MKTFELAGTPRIELGKKAVREIRKQDLIPSVLYGKEPVALDSAPVLSPGEKLVEIENSKAMIVTDFNVTTSAVRTLVYTPNVYVVELTIGDKKTKAIIKDMQFHPLTDKILHIDFMEVTDTKPILINVPVKLEGLAEGVKQGGKMSLELRKVRVKALYNNVPERVVVNVDSLGMGKTIKVGDLKFEDFELANSKDAVICAVKLSRAAKGAQAKAGK